MYEFLSLSRDKFKNTLLAPLREVHILQCLHLTLDSTKSKTLPAVMVVVDHLKPSTLGQDICQKRAPRRAINAR